MKPFTCFVLCLLFSTLKAQINTDTIPKKANVIEIVTESSAEDNFLLAGQSIAAKNWEIANAYKDLGQIVTSFVLVAPNTKAKYMVLVKPEKIRITGEIMLEAQQLPPNLQAGLPQTQTGKVTNWGGNNSKIFKSFRAMLDLALTIDPTGKKIRFLIEN